MRRVTGGLIALSLVYLSASGQTAPSVLVVCAPGYPGTTEEAQSFMDGFAGIAAKEAGWPAEDLEAVYFENEATGLARMNDPEAALALVPLPFFLEHGDELDLVPHLHAVTDKGGDEVWALVARKGAVSGPADLKDFEVTGRPGYSPAFVKGTILGRWGPLPEETQITFTDRSLSALRRAAAGEKVAVILDREQTESLPSLPFGKELEVVTRSERMPGMILCAIGGRLGEKRSGELVKGLLGLHKSAEGADILRSIWMSRFETIDRKALERARKAFEAA